MHNNEEQVRRCLSNANQCLNFLRTVIDDLLLKRDMLNNNSLNKVLEAQIRYKKHKAVLTNIEDLLSKKNYPLSEFFCASLSKSLTKRIALIIELSIELDKER